MFQGKDWQKGDPYGSEGPVTMEGQLSAKVDPAAVSFIAKASHAVSIAACSLGGSVPGYGLWQEGDSTQDRPTATSFCCPLRAMLERRLLFARAAGRLGGR